MPLISLTKGQLDELSQFLFWIEDREVVGEPWWPGEGGVIRFHESSEPLFDAVQKVHAAYRKVHGIRDRAD